MQRIHLILFCAIVTLCNYSESQLIRTWGIKIGATSANQSLNYPVQENINLNIKNRLGLDVGLFVEWLNDKHFSILTEVHYIQKGFYDKETFTVLDLFSAPRDTQIVWEPRVEYLSFPVMIKYRLEIGNISPYIIVGPRLDVLLKNVPSSSYPVLNHLTIGGITNTDFGMNVGFGIELSTFDGLLVGAEFQYSPSFDYVYDKTGITIRNQSMQFCIFVSF